MKIPVTKEEKARAAAKYGMIPEDYEPYGERGYTGYDMGDYPKLIPRSCNERPGHINYDYPNWKRDFGEPFHANQLHFIGQRNDTGVKPWSVPKSIAAFFACTFTMWAIMFLGPNYEFPICEQQIPPRDESSLHKYGPPPGTKHYLFETDSKIIGA